MDTKSQPTPGNLRAQVQLWIRLSTQSLSSFCLRVVYGLCSTRSDKPASTISGAVSLGLKGSSVQSVHHLRCCLSWPALQPSLIVSVVPPLWKSAYSAWNSTSSTSGACKLVVSNLVKQTEARLPSRQVLLRNSHLQAEIGDSGLLATLGVAVNESVCVERGDRSGDTGWCQ